MSIAAMNAGVTADRPGGSSIGGSTRRLAGLSALAFGAAVLVANLLHIGAPMADVPALEAATWYEANQGRVMLSSGMVGLAFPALLIFSATMLRLGLEREAASPWMLVGALGGVALVGVFAVVAAGQIGSVLLAGTGGAGFLVAWTIHNAAFAVNMTVLGTAFLGFALGAESAGLTPRWQRTVGVIGATLLLVTGFANAAVAAGSQVVGIGFVGFLLWLFWIVATGLRLLRAPVPRPVTP